MDIWVLTISSEQGTTPPRRNWKYATVQKMAIKFICLCLCLYISQSHSLGGWYINTFLTIHSDDDVITSSSLQDIASSSDCHSTCVCAIILVT